MKPIVFLVPLAILIGGITVFLLVPLPWGVRTVVLVSDLFAACLVGWLLWRRSA